jgi:hypothetical protein
MALAVPTTLPRYFAWPVPVVLLLVLIASSLIFRGLVRRWTLRRHWLELSRWAADNRMALHGATKAEVPSPLSTVTSPPPTASLALVTPGDALALVEMHTLKAQRTDTSQFTRWHVLVRRTESQWPSTGLRPRANASSVLDLFPLTSFPSMIPPDRFVIFGAEAAAARRVAASSLPALLPPDVGLLLHGSSLILDFTVRPFDPMELSRMCALADQLLAHLPPAK